MTIITPRLREKEQSQLCDILRQRITININKITDSTPIKRGVRTWSAIGGDYCAFLSALAKPAKTHAW